MLSLSKILFTALIIVIVWKGMKFLSAKGQAAQVKDAKARSQRQARARSAQQARNTSNDTTITADLEKCPKCGVYHAEGSSHICED